MDPWWNNAMEAQAIDRVYRIGQTKPVKVFQILIEGTIEERVLEIQNRKKDLIKQTFEGILQGGRSTTEELKLERIRNLKYIFGMTDQAGNAL
jgi:SWI/SNF-related matrix-associated actin-dependent regulator of chromatin subfamily A3